MKSGMMYSLWWSEKFALESTSTISLVNYEICQKSRRMKTKMGEIFKRTYDVIIHQ